MTSPHSRKETLAVPNKRGHVSAKGKPTMAQIDAVMQKAGAAARQVYSPDWQALRAGITAVYPDLRAQIVAEIVEVLRKDAADNQPSQRMDSWDCADLIEREFGGTDA